MSTPRTVSRSSVEGGAGTQDANTTAENPEVAKPAEDLNDEKAELERAVAAEQLAYQEGEKARRESLVMQAQRGGGDVNHEAANNAMERATQKARDKARKKRPLGVYVVSPIKVLGAEGPVFAPIGFRLTDYMISHLGEKTIADYEAQELLEDLRS